MPTMPNPRRPIWLPELAFQERTIVRSKMSKQPEKGVGCSGNMVWALLIALVVSALLSGASTRADTAQMHTVTLPLVYNQEPDVPCWIMGK